MRRGFTLLEVLLAAVILGFGLAGVVVAMAQSQRFMQTMPDLMTAQEVMDLGDMAYPLSEVRDADDIDVGETRVDELWRVIAGSHGPRMTNEQEAKYHGFRWSRERLEPNMNDDDLKRIGHLRRVKVTVTWGDRFRGDKSEESYVTLWRDRSKAE